MEEQEQTLSARRADGRAASLWQSLKTFVVQIRFVRDVLSECLSER